MIEFDCPHCQKHIKVDDSASGKSGTCHGCHNRIDVPVKPELVLAAQPALQVPAVQQRTSCIYCGEDIAAVAIKCKHCGEFQDGRQSQPLQEQPSVVVNVSAPYDHRPSWNPILAMFLGLFFPGLGQLYKGQTLRAFMWFWAIAIGYIAFIIPGIILQFCCLIDAGVSDPDRKRYRRRY